jgi:hypothetical protein
MTLITQNFNALYPGPFFKWIHNNEKTLKNKNYTFTLGLNTVEDFKPKGECSQGGLYFTGETYLHEFTAFGNDLFKITIPDDAFCMGRRT